MQISTRTEIIPSGAICNREGQLLSVQAAPFTYREGDLLTDHVTPADRRFLLALPPECDAVCLCCRVPFLCLRSPFGGMLWQIIPLAASAAALCGMENALAEMGLVPSPGICASRGQASPMEIADAADELIRLRHNVLTCSADRPIAQILDRLAMMPPLCSRQLDLRLQFSTPLGGDWPVILYCLIAVLCRHGKSSPVRIADDGTIDRPMLLLSADSPTTLPVGRCSLDALSLRIPEVRELAVAARLAARSRIDIEAFADGDGCLCFAMAERLDPAIFGFKQPIGLNVGAAEAAEAEWCRLLRDGLRAAK